MWIYYEMSVKSSLESMLLFIYARLKIKPFVFVFVDVKFGYAHKTGEWWDSEMLHTFVKRVFYLKPPSHTSHIHVVILETKIKKYAKISAWWISNVKKPSSISLPLVSNAVMACNFSIKSRTECNVLTNWTTVLGGMCLVLIPLDMESLSIIRQLRIWPLIWPSVGWWYFFYERISSKKGKKIPPTSNFI